MEITRLPDWMFISIFLFGNTLNKTIKWTKNVEDSLKTSLSPPLWGGFDVESKTYTSWAILGISISSILLSISILAQYKEFELSSIFYTIEEIVFLVAIVTSAIYELIIFKILPKKHTP